MASSKVKWGLVTVQDGGLGEGEIMRDGVRIGHLECDAIGAAELPGDANRAAEALARLDELRASIAAAVLAAAIRTAALRNAAAESGQ